MLPLLLDLHDSNRRQWDLEDVTRAEDASDSVVAGAKRAVDRLNLARHQLIQKIDAAVEIDLDQSTTATLATETPGMVFDRLSVLVIRLVRTAEMARLGLRRGRRVPRPAPEPAAAAVHTLDGPGITGAGGASRYPPVPALRAHEAVCAPAGNRAPGAAS